MAAERERCRSQWRCLGVRETGMHSHHFGGSSSYGIKRDIDQGKTVAEWVCFTGCDMYGGDFMTGHGNPQSDREAISLTETAKALGLQITLSFHLNGKNSIIALNQEIDLRLSTLCRPVIG